MSEKEYRALRSALVSTRSAERLNEPKTDTFDFEHSYQYAQKSVASLPECMETTLSLFLLIRITNCYCFVVVKDILICHYKYRAAIWHKLIQKTGRNR